MLRFADLLKMCIGFLRTKSWT